MFLLSIYRRVAKLIMVSTVVIIRLPGCQAVQLRARIADYQYEVLEVSH